MELGYLTAYLLEKLRMTDESARGQLKAGIDKLKTAFAGNGSGDAILDYIQEVNDRAIWSFIPKPADFHLKVFKPEKNYDFMQDRNMGWSDLVRGNLDVIELPVNPHAMLSEPFVQDLGRELKLRLKMLVRPEIFLPAKVEENLPDEGEWTCRIREAGQGRV